MIRNRISMLTAGLLAGVSALGAAQPANAQAGGVETAATDAGFQLGEIVVTANRRKENMQNVPMAISAFNTDQLAKANIDNTLALTVAVPGLTMQNGPGGVQPHIRGIGTTAFAAGQENSIATYVDGVYIASMNSSVLKFNSIQAIEVLKGPQGTLFGRNATGGVINIITRDPSHDLGLRTSISYGNYDTVSTNAYLTGGISDTLAADLSVLYSNQGEGWGRNLFTGAETAKTKDFAARTKWLFTPGDDDRITLIADYARSISSWIAGFRPYRDHPTNYGPGTTLAAQRPDLLPYIGPGLAPFAEVGDPFVYPANAGPWDSVQTFTPKQDTRQWGVSLNYDHTFDFGTLTSLTAYRKTRTIAHFTSEPVPADRVTVDFLLPDRQFSQELRLASADGSALKWLVGLYYLNGKVGYDPFSLSGTTVAPLQSLNFNATQKTRSGAAFGQATVPLGSSTNLTGGLRYTVERRSLTGNIVAKILPDFPFPGANLPDDVSGHTDDHKVFKKLTWRLALDHRFSDGVLGYVSYNRGFKSGVYNTIPPGGAATTPVNPEVLDAYEIGLKTDLFDRRLRLNLAGFYYDYSDLQVTLFNGTTTLLQNGAKARMYGLDADFDARITENFSLRGGMQLLDHKFKSFPGALFSVPQTIQQGGGNLGVAASAAGNKLPYTADVAYNVTADYTIPTTAGTFNLSATYAYTDNWFSGPDNILESPKSHMVNGQLSWALPGEQLRFIVWGRNILDKAVPTYLVAGVNPGGFDAAIYAPPRTYGITLEYAFGR